MMKSIAFIIKESSMGFNEVMNLPYTIFLSLLKQFQMLYLLKDQDYVDAMKNEKLLSTTEPDWSRLEPLIERKKV